MVLSAAGRGREKSLQAGNAAKLIAAVGVLAVVGVAAWTWIAPMLDSTSEQALARRAQLFWDLKVAGDTLGAYDLMSATYRRRVTPAQFAREGGRVVRTGATVKGVTLDDSGGLVDVEMSWRFAHPNFAELDQKSVSRERWVLEDGSWYRWPPSL